MLIVTIITRSRNHDYRATNSGPGTAYAGQVTGATATRGVYLITPVPLPLGDISQGGYAPFTLKYFVPVGVGSFTTTVYATAKDHAGSDYYYPARRSSYAYNQANQLTSLADGATLTGFTYNAAGALTQKSTGEETTNYSYNGLDKLTQVTTPNATVTYAYDALGRRISRTEGTETANYHLNGKSDLEDYQTDSSGVLSASYQRGADGLISETDYRGQTPVTSYNLYNPHGDTAAQTDQAGTVTQSYRYDAFGNAINSTPPRNGYTGKWQRDSDGATATIRMGVREYDPTLGRFVSADPLKGTPTDPQQRNRYTYTSNNPLVRYDLNGLWWGGDAWGWVEDRAEEVVEGWQIAWEDPSAYASGAWEFLFNNDWQMLTGSDSSWSERVEGGAFLALNFVPGGKGAKCGKLAKGAKSSKGGVKATIHGAEALAREGFNDDLVKLTKNEGQILRQSDGALVYLRESSPGRFDFIVEGENGVITAHRNFTQKAVDRIAKNYGWGQ